MNAWLREHPWRADVLLAVALLVVSAPQFASGSAPALSRAGYLALMVLLVATVIPRRRYPVAAFVVAVAIAAAQIAFGVRPGQTLVYALQPTDADLAILVLLYTLAAYRPRPVSITGLAVCLLGSVAAIARWAPAQHAGAGAAVFAAAVGLGGLTLAAWVLGDSVAYRYRRAYYASLEERAARLEAEREAQARIAAAAERARELQERRARAVDESAARLRGIERDLHDGAQVRLAALAMTLGEIKENLEQSSGDDHTLALVGAAHQNAKDTLAELRDLARGIHPPVLDRGLGPALGILAGTSAIPVGLTVALTERPSPAIEAMAYFCAAELLANAAKHSGASRMTATPECLRIVIAEDAAIMRDGLTQTLTRRGHDVVAAVADAETLRQAVEEHRPDVAIIDVRMPPSHTDEGLRAAQAIHHDHPRVGVLVFSQYIEAASAAELFASAPAGVGYLLKDRVADVSDFIDAIIRVAHGGTVLDPEVVRQLLTASRRGDTLAALTPREREVLSLIAQGRSNAAIAATLFISPKVVEKHVANIFDKLGLAPDDNDNRRVIAALRYLES